MESELAPKIRVVAETESVQALFLPGRSDTLLVTFNGMGSSADGRSFAADAVAQELGLSALGFMSRAPNWFPPADMQALAGQLTELICSFSNRLLYGFSMGGYGALKHSRLLNATYVLAVGPQWSIDPKVAPWEQRYVPYVQPWHRKMQIAADDCAGEIFIVFDDHDPDALHAAEICKAVHCHQVLASFTSHDVWRIFFSISTMENVIAAILASDVVGLRRIVRARRREIDDFASRVYSGRAERLVAQGRLIEGERAARNSLRCGHVAPGIGYLLCMILIERGDPVEAEAVMRKEMARDPDLLWLSVYLSRALEAQGRYAEALEAVAPVWRKTPHLVEAAEAFRRLSALV